MGGEGGGGPREFLCLKFGQKGFFWGGVCERRRDFFGHEKTQGFFWVLYLSSDHINNNISAIYCLCGIFFGMIKKVGIFWG